MRQSRFLANLLKIIGAPEGFEPLTFAFGEQMAIESHLQPRITPMMDASRAPHDDFQQKSGFL
jgi:hypothetical protein